MKQYGCKQARNYKNSGGSIEPPLIFYTDDLSRKILQAHCITGKNYSMYPEKLKSTVPAYT